MKNKLSLITVFLGIFIILSAFANAQIILSQPKEVYNIGDIISVNFSVSEQQYSEGIFKLSLVCNIADNSSQQNGFDFYKKYLQIPAGQKFSESAILRFNESFGNCYVLASFVSATTNTQNFLVTNEIKLSVDINKKNFIPGEQISITGKAVKANSQVIDGTGVIKVSNVIEQNFAVSSGDFAVEIILPSNSAPGQQDVSIEIHEGGNGGFWAEKITIAQVPTKLDIITDKDSFNPKEKLIARAVLYDQASQIMQSNLSIKLFDPKDKLILDKLILSNGLIEYEFPSNASAGDWKIEAYGAGISEKKFILMQEYEAVDISLVNNTLIVRNIGNVPYNKPIVINLTSTETGKQESVEIKTINLGVDEESSYKLEAPDSNYDISVEGKTFRNSPLTGKVAAAIEINKEGFLAKNPLLASVLFFGFLIIIILGVFMSRMKQHLLLKPQKQYYEISTQLEKITDKLDTKITGLELEKEKIKSIFTRYVGTNPLAVEEHNLHGKKQNVTAMFVDIRGFSQISEKIGPEKTVEMLNNYFKIVTNAVYSYGGIVNHLAGDGVFALFNNVEKEEYNELAAVKSAIKILDSMRRIGYSVGIGINSGEAIVGTIGSEKVMKFSAVGSSINIAQKLEEKAQNSILVTKNVYEKIKYSVKAERAGFFNIIGKPIEAYRVEDIEYKRKSNEFNISDLTR